MSRTLSLVHPGIDVERVPYTTLLTDFDVEQFETHFRGNRGSTAVSPGSTSDEENS